MVELFKNVFNINILIIILDFWIFCNKVVLGGLELYYNLNSENQTWLSFK